MALELNLPPQTEARIRELAAASGQDVQTFVLDVLTEKLSNCELPQPLPSRNESVMADGSQLPAWCRVYEGLTDDQIDELDRSIFRSPSSRDVS